MTLGIIVFIQIKIIGTMSLIDHANITFGYWVGSILWRMEFFTNEFFLKMLKRDLQENISLKDRPPKKISRVWSRNLDDRACSGLCRDDKFRRVWPRRFGYIRFIK